MTATTARESLGPRAEGGASGPPAPPPPLLAVSALVRRLLVATTLLRLSITATHVAQAVALARAIVALAGGGPFAACAPAFAALSAAVAARFGLVWAAEVLARRTAAATKERVRAAAFAKLAELGPAFLTERRAGELRALLVEGVESLEAYFGQYLPALANAFVAPLGTLAFFASRDAGLAAVVAAFAVAIAAVPLAFDARLRRRGEEHMDAYLGLGADFLDSAQGVATLKALGAVGARRRKLEGGSSRVAAEGLRLLVVALSRQGVTTALLLGGGAAAVVFAAARAASGGASAETLVLSLLLTREVFRPFDALSSAFHTTHSASVAAARLGDLLAAVPRVREPAAPAPLPPAAPPTVEFEGLSFRHEPGGPWALEGVSFRLGLGETVAVVGASGAGKTTLASLLLRFFEPDGGRIVAFGRDVRTLSSRELRSKIAAVSQETHLFAGTVLDNLRLAKPDATREEAEAAARDADAHDFVSALPDGYDTRLGERGARLSGGQRQRLTIARALLADPPILLLDEASSSLDDENERAIQDALRAARQGRTALVVAHRPSTIRGADRIVVLDGGRVVEAGRHDELAAAGGAYARHIAATPAGG